MTPYEHWCKYTERLHAPKVYLKLGFYFMVSAALQRRVWIGNGGQEVYPNQYHLLVGKPGVGKGLVMGAIKYLMGPIRGPSSERFPEGAPVFPTTSESTSFERLVEELIKSTNSFMYRRAAEDKTLTPYVHASATTFLDEFTSLFRKDADQITPFFLTMWMCGDYKRSTKKNGDEFIRNPCLSMLAGTQPDTLQDLIRSRVVGTGLLARVLPIYAEENAFQQMFMPPLTEEQQASGKALQEYLKKLAGVFGPLSISPDTSVTMNRWIQEHRRMNKSVLLDEYYGRKTLHAQKLAMAIHFAKTTASYILTTEDLFDAIALLEELEPKMHLAFTAMGMNKFATTAEKIVAAIKSNNGPVSYQDLLLEFYTDLKGHDLAEVLIDLVEQGKLKSIAEKGHVAYVAVH